MITVTLDETTYTSRDDETILDTLLRNSHHIPFSCRNGTCMTCLLKVEHGNPSQKSQAGLPAKLKSKNFVKACKCVPKDSMILSLPNENDYLHEATIEEVTLTADGHSILSLELDTLPDFHAGQTVAFRVKSYHEPIHLPILSTPGDTYLSLLSPNYLSEINTLISKKLKKGDSVFIGDVQGEFHFTREGNKDFLIIADTPTIALAKALIDEARNVWGFTGKITLLTDQEDGEECNFMAQNYAPQIEVITSSLRDYVTPDFIQKYLLHRIYIAAEPGLTEDLYNLMLSYAAKNVCKLNLHPKFKIESIHEKNEIKAAKPNPHPELWDYLNQNNLLNKILNDFYEIVFADERLGGFFSLVTKQRLVEKQYNFLFEQMTGKPVYFGADMRNAHHWMVISNDLFDHRANILESVIDHYDVPEDYKKIWLAIEDQQRERIVKTKPWDKLMDGTPIHLDRFEKASLDMGGVCDNCSKEISPGETVKYHLRLGKVYCKRCA